ncbi:transmembrane protein 214 isoform X2 [Drosophila obscura]|uniref:transmembrane protein 214 isoform X2 n=1 Tax=Drosophila obscura TaxID=7282 RepID=UPI001BB242D4|nr:transmembrane protein 214 isoform X2 [Drosophila obscura]
MSNQWEVVTKSRKQKNLDKKVYAHTEQKRIAAQTPKLEELLPSQQYRNLFATSDDNNYKSNSPAKSSSSASSSKNKSPVKKNNIKTITTGGSRGGGSTKQPAKPKTLEQALKHITPDDFASQLEQVKLSCPGSELRWLSHIALYFNGALSYDCDPVFSGRSAQYPSNLASAALKKLVVEFLGSVGESNLEYFFHYLLDGMTTDLNNNQTVVVGYKFMLQLIGQAYPSICSKNFAKTALLRNCYQNRSSICLSILWAIGQGGYTSLNEGVKIWQNLMLPNLELKNYSKFVVEYIERVLNAAAVRTSEDILLLNQNEFFAAYNSLNATYNNLPKELQQSLKRSASQLLQKYISSPVKHANIFLTLFRDITTVSKPNNEIEGCLSCLLSSGGDDCLKVWRMNYKKQQLASLLLLQAIDLDWETSTNLLAKSPVYHSFLHDLPILNDELQSSKRKESCLNDLIEVLVLKKTRNTRSYPKFK